MDLDCALCLFLFLDYIILNEISSYVLHVFWTIFHRWGMAINVSFSLGQGNNK